MKEETLVSGITHRIMENTKRDYIGFQDHGSNLSFRNVKIKKL
jgi:hypothetical protein